MTLSKDEISEGMNVLIETQRELDIFSQKTHTIELTVDTVDTMFEEPLEFTGYDNSDRKYKVYLDKNKISLLQDESGEFQGAIGTVTNISEV